MKNLKRLAVEHPYYCSDSNYYSNEASQRYETASEFIDDWKDADIDMNMIFRWDIKPRSDSAGDHGRYCAEIFIMLQRKGIFMPVYIAHINDSEAVALEMLLKKHWEYLQKLWNPISAMMGEES